MLLSPVGLSTMTKLAPSQLGGGLVMGIWFLASALGDKLAGVLAGQFESDNLTLFFGQQAGWVAAIGVLLGLLSPWVSKLMGDVR